MFRVGQNFLAFGGRTIEKSVLQGFKLRYTGLSIDRHPSTGHVSS